MPLLNYTTTVDAAKSAAEVQTILAKAGANQVAIDYDKNGSPDALTFTIVYLERPVAFRLPCNVEGVYSHISRYRSGVPRAKQTREQARRIAWRIIKDWTEAQLAIVQCKQAELPEVFLPYIVDRSGRTMFARFTESHQKQLMNGETNE